MTTDPLAPVSKTVTVRASVQDTFTAFTEGFDGWWPRSHHIGSSPMKKAIIECRLNGACTSLQEDGTYCPWGTVTAWEPPHRFVFAWQITPDWKYQPDLATASEVEVRFIEEPDGRTRVELEHRGFERMGAAGGAMRAGVDTPQGWNGLLHLFSQFAEGRATS